MDIDEALKALLDEVTDEDPKKADGKVKALGQRLYKELKPVARYLIARGAGRKATEVESQHAAELKEKDEAIATLQEEKDAAEAEAEELRKKQPDTEKTIATLKAKHAADLKAKDDKIAELSGARVQDHVERAVDRFRGRLATRIDEDLVEGKVAEFRKNFRAGKNGTLVEVLAIGKDDEVIEAGEGEDEAAEIQLADAVAETVKPKFRKGSGTPGGGSGGGGNGGAPRATPQANVQKLRGSGHY